MNQQQDAHLLRQLRLIWNAIQNLEARLNGLQKTALTQATADTRYAKKSDLPSDLLDTEQRGV